MAINEFITEAIPEGTVLFFYNHDQPGVIGNVGHVLASHGINIGQLHLSRDRQRGTAISMVHVDSPVCPTVLEALRRLPHIISAIQVEL